MLSFVLLWATGLMTSNTLGGFIHLLLVMAIFVVRLKIFSGRQWA